MTLELPLTLVSKISRTLQASVRATRSPSTGYGQVQDWLGEWWAYDLTFGLHTRSEGRRVGAFFNRLRGPATPFILRDPSLKPEFTGGGAPVTNPAQAMASTLVTSGWTPSFVIPAGTFFSLGEESPRLHQVVETQQASLIGQAVLTIAPRLRAALPQGVPLVLDAPGVILQLTSPVPSLIERAETYTFSVRAEEWL